MPTQQELRTAFRDMIVARDPDMMVTFNYRRALPRDYMQTHIGLFMNRAQRRVFGRSWCDLPVEQRPALIGMAEHLNTNPHVHGALIATEPFLDFMELPDAYQMWMSTDAKCGQLHVGRTRGSAAMAGYITKTLWAASALDNAIYYVPRRRERNR